MKKAATNPQRKKHLCLHLLSPQQNLSLTNTGNHVILIVVPLSEGAASVPINNIGVGKHGIVVMYSGDDT